MLVVPRTPTPLSQAAFPGLIDAAFAAEGRPLRGLQRMMLAVLASIETARGRSMFNHNVGNITASPSYQGSVWRPPWFELNPGALQRGEVPPKLVELNRLMHEGKAPSAFRAYATLDEGARDFARVLVRNFPEVLEAALSPNADGFRAALAEKYSHDYRNPKATASIAQLMKEYGITAGAAAGGTGVVVLLVALYLVWHFGRRRRA